MNFRWLQFWGDLREGIHPSWQTRLVEIEHEALRTWAQHHAQSAAALRAKLEISSQWDAGCDVARLKWLVLSDRDFGLWCEAVGLLTLGSHLRRIVSLKTMQRMKVSLGRDALASVVQFSTGLNLPSIKPLPLDLPTARELGERALADALRPVLPRVWSRARLRFPADLEQGGELTNHEPVFQPTFEQLSSLDEILFDGTQRPSRRDETKGANDEWMLRPTLSA